MKPFGSANNKSIRLQVFLSRNGVCSRRDAMRVIADGRVSVNGKKVLEPSTPVAPDADEVKMDGKVVGTKAYTYILLNKPAGYVTTKAEFATEKNIFALLPATYRHLLPAGRLDKNTEGLLLLTNNGDVIYKLTHPKFNIDKLYFVRIDGRLAATHKTRLEKGIILEGKKTAPATITGLKVLSDKTECRIAIHEGRKRQIRYMFARFGYRVTHLKRLAQGPLALGELKPGAFRELSAEEIRQINSVS